MILLNKDTEEQMEGRKLPTWADILSYSHNTGITCLKIAFQAQFLMLRKRSQILVHILVMVPPVFESPHESHFRLAENTKIH